MFIGHFAVAFGAKRAAPAVSLGTLFLACQLADLLWPLLVLAGVERFKVAPGITAVTPLDFIHYPYSHSLLALLLWGAAFALVYKLLRRSLWVAPVVLAAVVLSHWVLDYATHRPDMPVTFASPQKVGLGLWSSVPGTLVVELLLFAIGVALYLRATAPRDRTGTLALSALVTFLLVIYFANVFGPPPPNEETVTWGSMAMWLIVAWGYWVDRHRQLRSIAAPAL
jgi:membrane-bound metal-dependent hydrolase YbcI (DUF457 family)